jgi:signal transduction histidine kinase
MLLNSATDTSELLNYIIDSVTALLECEGGAVLLFDEVSESLRFVASTGSSHDDLARIPVPLNDSVAGKVYVFGDPVMDNDTASSGQHFEEVGEKVALQTRSLLAVPLNVEGKTIGVLEAINKRSATFDVNDEHTLSMFANQAALAIRNEKQNERVRQSLSRLQEFERFRSEFLAIASHELRTPLSILGQSLDILEMESEEDLRGFAKDARSAADRLSAIVDSMAQLESLRLSSDSVQQEAVDLIATLADLVENHRAMAGRGRVMVTWAPPESDAIVRSHSLRVEQILKNGLTNALSAVGMEGRIDVGIRLSDASAIVRVRDTGPGLPESQIEKVFDEFYQVEDHLVRSGNGLGIGLTVARKLARMDGGDVWLESAGPGTGVTFCCQLPLV